MGICIHMPKLPSDNMNKPPQIAKSRYPVLEEQKSLTEILREETKKRENTKKKACVTTSKFEVEDNIDAPNAVITDRPKSLSDVDLIKNALNKHFIFKSLNSEQLDHLINQMQHFYISDKGIVFEQGQSGSNFFVLATGSLEVIINEKQVNILTHADSFGELALLHDTARSATVKALENSTL